MVSAGVVLRGDLHSERKKQRQDGEERLRRHGGGGNNGSSQEMKAFINILRRERQHSLKVPLGSSLGETEREMDPRHTKHKSLKRACDPTMQGYALAVDVGRT